LVTSGQWSAVGSAVQLRGSMYLLSSTLGAPDPSYISQIR